MRTIELEAIVGPTGEMTVQLPHDIQPGRHSVVVVIEEQPVKKINGSVPGVMIEEQPIKKLSGDELRAALEAHSYPWGGYPPEETFRREDIYGDDER